MSVARTYTVTVQSTGYGNKYYIDGVQQATIILAKGITYKFDQSDSTNENHPLRFSTTSDGTHNSGSEYTTGVTTSGTPGNSGAYTQISVADSAPSTLYYYCSSHPGMGGSATITTSDAYGMIPWNYNSWASNTSSVPLTGSQATTALGTLSAFPSLGWGRSAWGDNSWGVDYTAVQLTAPSEATTAIGAVDAYPGTGWGRLQWGNSGWGVAYSVLIGVTGDTPAGLTASVGAVIGEQFLDVPLTAPSNQGASAIGSVTTQQITPVPLTAPSQMTSEVGDFDNAGTLVGWGRNGWGEEPYGDSFNKLVQPSGLGLTSSVGAIVPDGMAVGITGLGTTSAVGSVGLEFGASTEPISGVSATSSVGQIVAGIGVALTGQVATSSVGAITPADVVGLTGLQATSALGTAQANNTEIVTPTGLSATSSVGSIVVGIGVPLTAPSVATASVGAIVPADVVGLTGVEATSEIGTTGFGTLAYKDIDITGNTSYTDVNHAA
jgi:hypothetical protein